MEYHCGQKSKTLNGKHNKVMSDFCPQRLFIVLFSLMQFMVYSRLSTCSLWFIRVSQI